MNWTFLVLLVFSLWLAITCGVVANNLRQIDYTITAWALSTVSLALVLLAVYASKHLL